MWTGAVMAVLLAGSTAKEPPATPAESSGAQPSPISTTTPAAVDVLFASKFASSRFHAGGAWLSMDGKRVAFFMEASPAVEAGSSTLVIKDVKTDARLWRKDVLTLDESRHLSASALDRLVRSRLIEAHAKLPTRQWMALQGGALPRPDFFSDACFEAKSAPPRTVNASGLTVTYEEPRLWVEREGKRLVELHRPAWRAFNKSCDTYNPTWLQSLYMDNAQRVMLVGLGHCGADACPEPPQQFHAIALPSGAGSLQPGPRAPVGDAQVRVGFESSEDPPSRRMERASWWGGWRRTGSATMPTSSLRLARSRGTHRVGQPRSYGPESWRRARESWRRCESSSSTSRHGLWRPTRS